MPYVNIRITKEGGTFERRHGFCVSATFILARTKKNSNHGAGQRSRQVAVTNIASRPDR